MKKKGIKEIIKKQYAKIAKQESSCCCSTPSCCGTGDITREISKKIGYTEEELKTVPAGANLGLGCGNPVALASLKEGEIILDLGSGAGFDCFLAAQKVGKGGKVMGVDMTPEMIEKARENARKGNYENVEFRLGDIEDLPIADNSVDVVISNCVINLAPDKKKVFAEAFRVLKPGGRLMISDIVLLKEPPALLKNSIEAYIGCLSGALMRDEYIEIIRQTGFHDVVVVNETHFPIECISNDVTVKDAINNLGIPSEKMKEVASSVASIKISGTKPGGERPVQDRPEPICGCAHGLPPEEASPAKSTGTGLKSRLAGIIRRMKLRELAATGLPLGLRILGFFLAFSYLGHLLTLAFPSRWMLGLFGQGRFHAVPLAAALGVPIYINAEVSMPVIKSFMEMGMSPGAALALIITGAGTSIGAITGAFVIAKRRIVGLVVGSLWLGAVLAGCVYDLVLAMA